MKAPFPSWREINELKEENQKLKALCLELITAGEALKAGLEARIAQISPAFGEVPVYDGIAELHNALNVARAALGESKERS